MKNNHLTPLLSALVLATFLCGCGSTPKEIRGPDLHQAFIINSSPTFQGYFYVGSDATHHHFEDRWQYQRDRAFKVPLGDLVIADPFARGTDERHLYVFKPSPDAPVLFSTGGHDIYGLAPNAQKHP